MSSARATDARADATRPAAGAAVPAGAPTVPGTGEGGERRARRPRRRRPRGGSGSPSQPQPQPDSATTTPRLAEDGPEPAPTFSDGDLDALAARLPDLSLRDEHRLARRLDTARRTRDTRARDRALAGIAAAVDESEARLAARRAAVPAVSYPPTLPVSARREDIAAAIRDHQVVVVAGETGSGKTTQIPKICLELGRGVRGLIGHTQPRRLAARTVAARIAEELGSEIGDTVGWKVRFTDQVGENTLVKLMTDGILLAELTGDRMLRQYDTLIIDEAHERSLNIDFILGYLAQLLPRRPDLKVIITSATIDPQRFASHFATPERPAPIVEVSGRSFPVEMRYRPVVDPDDPDADPDRDQLAAIADAVTELRREGPGDILVFLPGEREIRDTAEGLAKRQFPGIEILPLYARQTTAEQQRVFAPKQGSLGRRVVLATNVAETSLTVPGIRYVIDPGLARISRYSRRLKVQRLPIEKVSQASANQRAGRCGRVADGICIRLYAEDDFDARPEFTDPEILRTNLASVVLQMISLELGEITEFPFVDPPDRRSVDDGLALLHELGALDAAKGLTAVGRALASLPVDPRLGRMLVEADRNSCLREVLVIAAALSVQDPRERPTEQRQAADEKHARFAEDGSDFLAFRNLWTHVNELRQELSGSRFRRTLREEFLHYLRIREWQDLHAQLRSAARNAGMTLNDADASPDAVHTSVLAGLLSQIGLREAETKEYLGARGAKFMIFPGSSLAKKGPRWVMAAELVETSRLFARTVARIKPEWVEPLAGHLVKRTYSEPHWSRKRAAAVAVERVTLYGVPIVVDRTVDYGRIDPEVARELFVRHALVEGDWDTRHHFFHANRALLEDVEELEHRTRRRDLVVDEETLVAFYEARIPAHVVSGRHFDSWWRKNRDATLLDFTEDMLVTSAADGVDRSAYPDAVEAGGLTLPLSYAFEPGRAHDGVTVDVPVAALHQIDPTPFTWQVPGLREELVTALIKTLPKTLRRNFAPAPDHARAVLARLRDQDEPLLDGLERELGRMKNVTIPREAWELGRLPEHLTVTFRVVDEAGHEVTRGTDLEALRRELAPKVRAELAAAGVELERTGLTTWTIGTLPREHAIRRGRHTVTGYPGLVDRGASVDVRVWPTAAERDPAHHRGVRRLLLLDTPSPAKQVQRDLDNAARLALARNPHGSVAALLEDCTVCAADALVAAVGGPPFDERSYLRAQKVFREKLVPTTLRVLHAVRAVLDVRLRVQALLADTHRTPGVQAGLADVEAQLAALVGPGFATAAGASRLGDVARYLEAVERRIEKLRVDPVRDAEWTAQVRVVADEYAAELAALPPGVEPSPELREVRWMIEELRVSLYAHPMRTRYPVSIKRIQSAIDALPRA
ncbi:ATP-dependent RNA helicase HrpA [Pseudonocardia sp. KRD-184]|uniref:ATP-dependent RNA helicase HrpA n=1 Tax=Pseudonocardia oceani TaxID=2792013 RepID=A0ABS6UAR8_9PSEU|nr:ATP-dependent RNA helicase HrpA [Pseudonocardia oceani]MBW0092305.1 ATP-dependent RNA helicase HrpA [Pseudonocardia oceani]MBW0096777.1 ATP-dependent RNA helicase HrpA [Pseudonocardia oceani]MBW0111796.1 ATP-dependent RNA helicase HrpA [Pseudonocardia oceani]MBW0123603.1 ATP-dependent RNA helicase HrpA [Pseudonocardia oceani]MBW0129339.1 ATP-dependent RNA helicase HrpA [Pseudonocardia oceani]